MRREVLRGVYDRSVSERASEAAGATPWHLARFLAVSSQVCVSFWRYVASGVLLVAK